MSSKTRRQFLSDLGLSVGAITLVRGIANAEIFTGNGDVGGGSRTPTKPQRLLEGVDFRFAPKQWQSSFYFPDDVQKSLVGRYGDLLYGSMGVKEGNESFLETVSFGVVGYEKGSLGEQSLALPSLPVITTKLQWKTLNATLTVFATDGDGEGRVDNVLLEFNPEGTASVSFTPSIVVTSEKHYRVDTKSGSSTRKGQIGVLFREDDPDHPFLLVDSVIELNRDGNDTQLKLEQQSLAKPKVAGFLIRIPRGGQSYDRVSGGFGKVKDLLHTVQTRWDSVKTFGDKNLWNLPEVQQEFLLASSRMVINFREDKEKDTNFLTGPDQKSPAKLEDSHFIIEAARYLGYDEIAQQALQTIWDHQRYDGSFSSGGAEGNWKETSIAVYALIRNAELTQNWDYFNSLYPDAWKAMSSLQERQKKAWDETTLNGKYGLLPAGYGDDGIGGTCAELTNTLWAMIAIKALSQIADRLMLQKNVDVRQFYTDLMVNFMRMTKSEMMPHPQGFVYLPMILKDDPLWKVSDITRRPLPQTAQVYLAHALTLGNLFDRESPVVKGYLSLINATMKEDVPTGTGWLKGNSVRPSDAAAIATSFLWLGQGELARGIFTGFLNHASPLYAWREEQSLITAPIQQIFGTMPYTRANAECIRFLRHMLVFEDEKDLRLLYGIRRGDLVPTKPFGIDSTPTRWGRVTISMEPAEGKRWVTKFKREGFTSPAHPANHALLPRWLPGNVQIDKITGAHFYKNGMQVEIDPAATTWEAVWLDFGKT